MHFERAFVVTLSQIYLNLGRAVAAIRVLSSRQDEIHQTPARVHVIRKRVGRRVHALAEPDDPFRGYPSFRARAGARNQRIRPSLRPAFWQLSFSGQPSLQPVRMRQLPTFRRAAPVPWDMSSPRMGLAISAARKSSVTAMKIALCVDLRPTHVNRWKSSSWMLRSILRSSLKRRKVATSHNCFTTA